jgi:hypothetical protein
VKNESDNLALKACSDHGEKGNHHHRSHRAQSDSRYQRLRKEGLRVTYLPV